MVLNKKDKELLGGLVEYHITQFKKDKRILHPRYVAIVGMHGKYLKALQDLKKKLTVKKTAKKKVVRRKKK